MLSTKTGLNARSLCTVFGAGRRPVLSATPAAIHHHSIGATKTIGWLLCGASGILVRSLCSVNTRLCGAPQ